MKLPEDIRKPLITVLLSGTAATIAALAVEAWRPISGPFWQHVAPHIQTSTLLSLCSILLLLSFALSAWVAYLHFPSNPTKFRKRFRFHPESGTHVAPSGDYICTRCLFEDQPLEVPLFGHKASHNGAQCPRCGIHYGRLKIVFTPDSP